MRLMLKKIKNEINLTISLDHIQSYSIPYFLSLNQIKIFDVSIFSFETLCRTNVKF